MKSFKYTKEHEWVNDSSSQVKIGITDYAAEQLGDVVHVELPQVGATVKKGQSLGVVESVKSVSDIYSPISGTVAAVNEALTQDPSLINQSPYDQGWYVSITPSVAAELTDLLSYEQYQTFLSEEV